jgi:hypothetical protein
VIGGVERSILIERSRIDPIDGKDGRSRLYDWLGQTIGSRAVVGHADVGRVAWNHFPGDHRVNLLVLYVDQRCGHAIEEHLYAGKVSRVAAGESDLWLDSLRARVWPNRLAISPEAMPSVVPATGQATVH